MKSALAAAGVLAALSAGTMLVTIVQIYPAARVQVVVVGAALAAVARCRGQERRGQ